MPHSTTHRLGGYQLAFFIFAVALLGAAAQKYLTPLLPGGDELPVTIGRLYAFVPAILVMLLVPAARRYCARALAVPIPFERRGEVAVVIGLQPVVLLAIGGSVVLWYWAQGGEMALARRIGEQMSDEAQRVRAFSRDGILLAIVIGTVVAPIVEELVFRATLYRLWAQRWGWFPSMLATSAFFAAYHPNKFAAFVASVILIALLRRTGSLRACILVHAAGNFMLWYPVLGQHVFVTHGRETGEIGLWPWHLAAFALLAILLPLYVWMSRDDNAASVEMQDIAIART
jgi:membrane protease YdiL (CAAX protease family)